MSDIERRWRLILGPAAESGEDTTPQADDGTTGHANLDPRDQSRDALLEALYGREYAQRERAYHQRERDHRARRRSRRGGHDSHGLNAPEWLREVRTLFPARTAEYLQREGLQRYGLIELLADPHVLAQATPDMALVRTLISCRSLLPVAAMGEARRIIRLAIADLERRLTRNVRARFVPRRRRGVHGGARRLSELDWPHTLRRNLRYYDTEADALVLRQLYFHARQRRHMPWELVLLVDQSGSMLDSIIHAAVLASVLCGISTLKTRLVLFDTRIVDLGDQLPDPVETLLGVQLGGGTDIAAAMAYAATRLQHPTRSLVVLISDFDEGGDPDALLRHTRALVGSGVKLLGLAALDREAQPDYNHHMARALTEAGMPIAAMTPERLADWIAEQLR